QSLTVIDGVSQIDPLLRGQTYPWLLAAEKQDPEMLFQTSYHMNFSEEAHCIDLMERPAHCQ
ncbi:MAG: hypothetical protein R6W76_01395, partial [Caldilinea sp.]